MNEFVPMLISGLIVQTLEAGDNPSRADFAQRIGLSLHRINQLIDDYAEPLYPSEYEKLAKGINAYCGSKFSARSLKRIWETQKDVRDYEEILQIAQEKESNGLTLMPC